MKKIVPFQKEIPFANPVAEITSISLEHTLKVEKENVCGEFIISGNYKMTESSATTEKFSYTLPFDISLDEHYLLDKVTVDVDDFYYEIINNNTLVVNIEVLIDHLEEKPLPVFTEEGNNDVVEETLEEEEREEKEETVRCIEPEEIDTLLSKKQEVVEEKTETLEMKTLEHPVLLKEEVTPVSTPNLFEQFSEEAENYATYKICIVREGDSVLTICEKYNISEEDLSKYNDLKNMQIGDKIIIPTNYVRN